ncbi:hypothetical protein CYMTET_42237 [Cymbomonas tetramitiformis]|uniref:Uncharacterized protein n=1 Tax=Cymbomonas tetramitiformis TaxID=36881 RepID=A0AAE0C6H0_9CHLO|nr:hypothetical protein CYMTET_42237 [Cymbomonas tetramitiformis]
MVLIFDGAGARQSTSRSSDAGFDGYDDKTLLLCGPKSSNEFIYNGLLVPEQSCTAKIPTRKRSDVDELFFHWAIDTIRQRVNVALEVTPARALGLALPEDCYHRRTYVDESSSTRVTGECEMAPATGVVLSRQGEGSTTWVHKKYLLNFNAPEGVSVLAGENEGYIRPSGYSVTGEKAWISATIDLRPGIIGIENITHFTWSVGRASSQKKDENRLLYHGPYNRGTFSVVFDSRPPEGGTQFDYDFDYA